MYTMTIDGMTLYDPTTSEYLLEAPLLHLEANKIGTLTFTIYQDNPQYEGIVLRQSIIRLYRDGAIYMLFRPVKRKMMFQGGVEYTCEEMTAFLNDFLRRPDTFTGTARELMAWCIQTFNSQAGSTKVIPPAEYIRSLWPIRTDLLLQDGGGSYHEYNENTGKVTYHPIGGLKQPHQLYVNQLLAVLGYYGNVYLPPTDTFDWRTLKKYTDAKNIRFGYGGDYSDIWYDGWAWCNEVLDKTAIIAAFTEDMQELIDSLPEDDDEWDQQGGDAAITFALGNTPASDASFDIDEGGYQGYWDFMQSSIVEQFGGYIIPRWSESTCTLDYCKDEDLVTCSQTIEFAENLADIYIDTDTEKIYSIIIPLGKDNITISTGDDDPDYLASEAAIGLYGKKEITKEWPEIETKQKLKSVAYQWLQDNAIRLKDEITVDAYDLKYAGVNTEYLEFMKNVRVKCEKLGVSVLCPISGVELQLDSPAAGRYTINSEQDSMADAINRK